MRPTFLFSAACSLPSSLTPSYNDKCANLIAKAVSAPNVVPVTFQCLSDSAVRMLADNMIADSDQTFAEMGQVESTLVPCGTMTSLATAIHNYTLKLPKPKPTS